MYRFCVSKDSISSLNFWCIGPQGDKQFCNNFGAIKDLVIFSYPYGIFSYSFLIAE